MAQQREHIAEATRHPDRVSASGERSHNGFRDGLGCRGKRCRPQSGRHPPDDEPGTNDEDAHAAAGGLIGEPLSEGVEAGLGGAVDGIAGPRSLGGDAGEYDERATAPRECSE